VLADAVVMADGGAGALDRVENRGVVALELRLILHLRHKDEIEILS